VASDAGSRRPERSRAWARFAHAALPDGHDASALAGRLHAHHLDAEGVEDLQGLLGATHDLQIHGE